MKSYSILLFFLAWFIPFTQLSAEITFHVENLAIIDHELSKLSTIETTKRLIQYKDSKISHQDPLHCQLICSSLPEDSLINYDYNSFAKGLMNAFAYHRPISISPDIIWLLISQSFSDFINNNPQKLQKLFVSHEGSMPLCVTTNTPMSRLEETDTWNEFFDDIQKQISSHTKNGIAELFVSDFSTTGPTEKAVSQITLMNAVKPYFSYQLLYGVCGIPEITLTGEVQDWHHIREKANNMKGYGIDWWIKDIDTILRNFEDASAGMIDTTFWQSMVKKRKPNEIRFVSCKKGDHITEFDGWFLKFYPYDLNGQKTPKKISYNYPLRPEIITTPVTLITEAEDDNCSEHHLELLAGIVGLKENTDNGQVTPVAGWIIKEQLSDEQLFNKYKIVNSNKQPVVLETDDVFPEFLKKFNHIYELSITFRYGIPEKPVWLDNILIDNMKIRGNVYNSAQKELLIKQYGSSITFLEDFTRQDFEVIKNEQE